MLSSRSSTGTTSPRRGLYYPAGSPPPPLAAASATPTLPPLPSARRGSVSPGRVSSAAYTTTSFTPRAVGPTAEEAERRRQWAAQQRAQEERRLKQLSDMQNAETVAHLRDKQAREEAQRRRIQEQREEAQRRREANAQLMTKAGQYSPTLQSRSEGGSGGRYGGAAVAAIPAAKKSLPLYKRKEQEWELRQAAEEEAARLQTLELMASRPRNPRPIELMRGEAVIRPREHVSYGHSISPDVASKIPTHFVHPDAGADVINRSTIQVPLSTTGLIPWLPKTAADGPPEGLPDFQTKLAVHHYQHGSGRATHVSPRFTRNSSGGAGV